MQYYVTYLILDYNTTLPSNISLHFLLILTLVLGIDLKLPPMIISFSIPYVNAYDWVHDYIINSLLNILGVRVLHLFIGNSA